LDINLYNSFTMKMDTGINKILTIIVVQSIIYIMLSPFKVTII